MYPNADAVTNAVVAILVDESVAAGLAVIVEPVANVVVPDVVNVPVTFNVFVTLPATFNAPYIVAAPFNVVVPVTLKFPPTVVLPTSDDGPATFKFEPIVAAPATPRLVPSNVRFVPLENVPTLLKYTTPLFIPVRLSDDISEGMLSHVPISTSVESLSTNLAIDELFTHTSAGTRPAESRIIGLGLSVAPLLLV